VMHTNNPFWQLSVAQAAPTNAPGSYPTPYRGGLVTVTNVGNMTFMLFPEYATHAVNVFQGLTTAGFYNSNTIFHRVINDFMIQGGDANTNGSGRLVFECDDEFHPQAMFTGSGQLAVANHGKDTGGAQFFVTTSPQRRLDFGYTIFGQLVRGFDVLTNISHTATGASDRPLADEIIQTVSYVPNTADTVLTLTATNLPGVTGTITVIASDGAGGQATNVFAATLVLDTNSNHQPFFYPNTVTNLVGPLNRTLTNFLNALELGGDKQYWSPYFSPDTDYDHAPNSSYNLVTNRMRDLTYNVTNVDGVMQATATVDKSAGYGAGLHPFKIGGSLWATTGNDFVGNLDEVALSAIRRSPRRARRSARWDRCRFTTLSWQPSPTACRAVQARTSRRPLIGEIIPPIAAWSLPMPPGKRQCWDRTPM
ncbi:MAG: peptidylprolyl isomerase, partial [Verrucomicrobia bacterium]|nr:peptidylprolyl isomerase [Verrucomicrobiota bacterium]